MRQLKLLLLRVIGKLYTARVCWPLCGLLIALPAAVHAQNLVPNPSFEQVETCPYAIGFQHGDRPRDWFSWNQSPDYFNACAQPVNGADTMVGVPLNGWAYQSAWDGEAYVGVYAFGTAETYREYVGAQLVCPLVVGQTYNVSFRANLARNGTTWNSGGACNNLGVLFTMASNAWTAPSTSTPGPAFSFRNHAHVYSQQIISDTADWVLVSGSFVADSAYRHIVLGNFFQNTLTDTVPSEIGYVLAYYLIDSVSVTGGPADCPTTMEERTWNEGVSVRLCQQPGMLVMACEGLAFYEVYHMSGVLVDAGSFTSGVQLAVEGWAAGVYVVNLNCAGEVERLKFALER